MRLAGPVSIAFLALCVAALAVAGSAQAAGRCGDHPWCNTSLTPDQRAQLLIDALTPQERIGLLAGDHPEGVLGRAGSHTGAADGVPRVDLPPFFLTDGPVGVRQGQATAFPSSMSLAASFDRRLARTYGAAVGVEAKLKGNDLVYGPTINMLRTPLWGRTFETYGEDPYLTARIGVEWIKGLQAQGVIANAKHFAANNQEGRPTPNGSEGSRFQVDARVDERTLREIYLPQFEAAVKEGRAGSVMCSYNRLNGPHACESESLLRDILRRDWGFQGFVLADYGASKKIDTGLRAGLDFEPFPFIDSDGGENYTPLAVQLALATGRIDQGLIDAAVKRLLSGLFAYGFFDRDAYADDDSRIDKGGHDRVAQTTAEKGTVLLKNRRVLPLDARRLKSIAVIGADADRFVNGGGSSDIEPYSFTSPLAAIRARAGQGVDVRFDRGDDLDRAAGVANSADVAIVVVADAAAEGVDKPCLELDCGRSSNDETADVRRDELVQRIVAANARTIVVLQTAGPVLTPWRDRAAAIVEAWYPGQAAGPALARVLFGDVDPGGRLPATFPVREQDLPTAGSDERYPGVDNAADYGEGVLIGYRWYDARRIAPAYPFGHGLSYSRFAFRDLRVRRTLRRAGATVTVTVVNRGRRTGTAVPQVYVTLPGAAGRVQPPRQLKGFRTVELRRRRARRITFRLDVRAFSYWDSGAQRWQVAPGCYRISVGRSSRHIAQRARLPLAGGRCGRRR
jgi:beta-glucosidase